MITVYPLLRVRRLPVFPQSFLITKTSFVRRFANGQKMPYQVSTTKITWCSLFLIGFPVHSPNLEGSSDIPAAVSPVPVVGLPFKSPSSESMVEVAIQNVARASYLSITHAAINADQSPSQADSQQGVYVTTTNSKSGKKRTQMETEMEQEGDGKPMKKRAKITVPAREQSSRYAGCHQIHWLMALLTLIVVSKIPITRISM